MRRSKISPKASRSLFSRTAQKSNGKNYAPPPQRGGYRM